MDLAGAYKTNPTLEIEGVWVDMPDPEGRARIKVARFSNPKYQAAIDHKLRPYRRQSRAGNIPSDVLETALIACIAESIILDWENIEDEGKAVPFSVENAKAMLVKYPDFRDFVSANAGDIALFRDEELEEGAENLRNFSAGKSSGEVTQESG